MTKAEILRKEIKKNYRSVRKFAMEMGIPYSTLVTALDRGIEGMAYGTVIRMCEKLNLNPRSYTRILRKVAEMEKIKRAEWKLPISPSSIERPLRITTTPIRTKTSILACGT